MPELSIVSGTFNRLEHLKNMIKSVRESVGGLSYEIILVDGGSNDKTIPWCERQKDIKLIKQGRLVGGIKAFNAGCEASTGKYVVILNDDIEVVGNTIKKSYEYMERHPRCGQVAYENRMGRSAAQPRAKYSVSYRYLYGQCCITRRWLGDVAGWWGNNEGLHTYGGDSRLGMRIWELGYRVDSLDGCAIIDHVVMDKMRRSRTALLRPGGPGTTHRDTVAFRRVWDGRLMPKDHWIQVPHFRLAWRAARGQLRTLRFRHNRPGTKVVRTAQLNAFRKWGPAMHLDHTQMVQKHGIRKFQQVAEEAIASFMPDLVIFQAHGAGNVQPDTVESMKKRWPWMTFVNFDGDLHNPLRSFHFEIAKACDMQAVISPDLFDKYANHGAHNVMWWYPAYEEAFKKAGDNRPPQDKLTGPDVICLMNRTPPEVFPEAHTRIESVIRLAQSGVNFKIYGTGWEQHSVRAAGVTYNDDGASAELYRNARMCLCISQSKDLYGYTSNRAFFAGAVGIPILCQAFNGMEDLGFVDGDTVISWSTFDEMFEKIEYYVKHPDECEQVGKRCREMVLKRHSHEVRNEALLAMLEPLTA